jgi:thioredoxin reductase (NADPH)
MAEQDHASKIMQTKAFDNDKINFIWDTPVEEILGTQEAGVNGLRLRNLNTDQESILECDGVFIAIGHKPNTELFKGQLELDDVGYLKTIGRTTATNISGVFA